MAKEKNPLDTLIDDSGVRIGIIAKKFGLSRSGFYKKRKLPKHFTAEDMEKIAKIINVDEAVVFEAVLKTKSS